jgi:poly(3-hydroxybutyrate) depolymerase
MGLPAAIAAIALVLVPPPPGEIVPDELLVLPSAGRAGRMGDTADPVEAAIVAERWAPPKAGERVAGTGGTDRTWTAIRPGGDGTFRHPALRGGYAFASIKSDGDAVMILEAAGHAMAYSSGEPRAGDPYSHGYVRVPIRLRAGENPLLFAAGRGSLRLKLTRPRAEAQVEAADPTLPDLVVGRPLAEWGAAVVLNASDRMLEGATLRAEVDGRSSVTPLPAIPPLGVRKVPFRIEAPAPAAEGKRDLKLTLALRGRETPVDSTTLTLEAVRPDRARRQTFVSAIDGSVQYYGLVPAAEGARDGRKPGLILTLHGASVEGIGQARVYKPKDWAHVVAPTNRRPYGFDWEDWGRLDAIEVLDLAQREFDPDPKRVYLTGHSMGGHGTWHVGVTFPDRFAAIAPSAGWVSLFSYGGRRRPEGSDPVAALIARAGSPSDTLALVRNLEGLGVYVLHGDKDDNVPVDQARTMRRALGEFHADFAYYERPGAGHWWGDACCDWPPLLDFLARHERPTIAEVRKIDFVTAAPSVSARAQWATVEAQAKPFERSAIHLRADPAARTSSGTTENVARLALDLDAFGPGKPFAVTLDGDTVKDVPGAKVWLRREGGHWKRIEAPSPALKGPGRSGPFKDAFRNRVVFVYGTRGTAEENALALAKARFDAETFWYRGNGSIDVVPDSAFDAHAEPDRNIVLYGHAESNAAWPALLGDGPVRVARGSVRVGGRTVEGDSLACLFVRPRPGSDRACVAAVAGTSPAGLRRAARLPYFNSGAAYPDLVVHDGEGTLAAGFFGEDWGVNSGEFAWRGGP